MDAKWFRNSFIWLIVMVFVLAIAFQVFHGGSSTTKSIDLTGSSPSVVSLVDQAVAGHGDHNVDITLDGTSLTLQEAGNTTKYTSTLGENDTLIGFLNSAGVPT